MSDLLPCPFCGSSSFHGFAIKGERFINCLACGAEAKENRWNCAPRNPDIAIKAKLDAEIENTKRYAEQLTQVAEALGLASFAHFSSILVKVKSLSSATTKLDAAVDALRKIADRHVIAGSTGDYRQGQLDALAETRQVAAEALKKAQ